MSRDHKEKSALNCSWPQSKRRISAEALAHLERLYKTPHRRAWYLQGQREVWSPIGMSAAAKNTLLQGQCSSCCNWCKLISH